MAASPKAQPRPFRRQIRQRHAPASRPHIGAGETDRDAVSPGDLEFDPRPKARGTDAIDAAALGAIARLVIGLDRESRRLGGPPPPRHRIVPPGSRLADKPGRKSRCRTEVGRNSGSWRIETGIFANHFEFSVQPDSDILRRSATLAEWSRTTRRSCGSYDHRYVPIMSQKARTISGYPRNVLIHSG